MPNRSGISGIQLSFYKYSLFALFWLSMQRATSSFPFPLIQLLHIAYVFFSSNIVALIIIIIHSYKVPQYGLLILIFAYWILFCSTLSAFINE